jgi:YHS domain-containing protein
MVPMRICGQFFLLLFVLAGCAGVLCSPGLANERILSNPNFQLALYGYDPVAYTADAEARLGQESQELLYRGLVWRFANEGNKVAFEAEPDRYLPAYGGYCALAAADGIAVAAQPDVFAILGNRVFLFRSPAARYAFLLEAETLIGRADSLWPEVIRTLSP